MFKDTEQYKIIVEYDDFSSKDEAEYFTKLSKKSELLFMGQDLINTVVTCGLPSFYLSKNIIKRRSDEIRYKWNLLNTALDVDKENYLIFSDKMKYLDETERVYLMYYVGMFITKLISDKIFGYDYLVHLGIVSAYKNIVFETKKRPDLIAFHQNDNDYSVFEAKGRTQVRNAVFEYAKKQVSAVKWMNGTKLKNGVVSVVHPVSYITNHRVQCNIKDPEVIGDMNLDISKSELIWLYYEPIFALLKEEGNLGEEHYDEKKIDNENQESTVQRESVTKNYIDRLLELDNNMVINVSMSIDLYNYLNNFAKKESNNKEIDLNEIKYEFNQQKLLSVEVVQVKPSNK